MISADAEWRAVRGIFAEDEARPTPFGEQFAATCGTHDVTVFHGGWGRISAAASTQFVIDHFQPDLLVNLGTCGGFEGRINRGAIVLVERTLIYDILEQMADPAAAIRHYSTELNLDWLGANMPSPVVRGLMVSGDRDIVAGDISGLVEEYGAMAADWESGAIAWVAQRNARRVLILRGVSDLVSPAGGEAYGNYELFVGRTGEIMAQLFDGLPKWLDVAAAGTVGPAAVQAPSS